MQNFSKQALLNWFCAVLCLGFGLARPVAAQNIDPAATDPGYNARKLQATQARPAAVTSSSRLASARITAQASALARPSCFEAFDTTATSTVLVPRGDDNSYGPVNLGFNFSLFGTIYNQVYINTNGNLTFGAAYGEYNASGFPINVPMIAAFWADVDTRNVGSGRVSYQLLPDRLVVTWNRVAYFTAGGTGPINKKNTFQLTIKANTAATFTGNDVLFAYDDMQWTTGNASGGSGGFGGTPATVGVNKGDGTTFIQTGRFNMNNAQAPNNPTVGTPGGIDYLDGQCLGYQVRGGGNVPPAVAGFPANNTLTVTQGQTTTASFQFSGPETNQTVNVTSNLGGLCNATATTVNNNTANPTVNLSVTGAACNLGSHTVSFTALDNGTPLASQATFALTVVVVPPPAPTITSFTPDNGAAGTSVLITGTNFTGASGVSFNGTAASSFVVNSATSITAIVASGTTTGPIMVTTLGGSVTSATNFTVPVLSSVSLLYQTGDLGQPLDGQVRPFFQLVNSGTTAVPYSSLTVRYWLTVENFSPLVTPIDYAKLGTSLVSARYMMLATPRQGAYGYIEYSFAAGAGSLAAGGNSGDIYGKAYKQNYTNFDETNDWSYQTSSSYTTNSHVTVYQNGTLINGTEPPAVASATSLKVYAGNQDTSPTTNYISVALQVGNVGNRPVNFADLKVRYWFTPDGTQPLVYQIDYTPLGNQNFSLQTGQAGTQPYAELSYGSGLGTFYPSSNTGTIQFKIRKSDYSAFTQTNDYSFSGSSAIVEQPRITAYLNGQLVFGTEPSGASASTTAARSTQSAAAPATAKPATAASSPALESPLEASPNPVADHLQLRFALAQSEAYTLAVYDGQGRLVTELASGQAAAGEPQLVEVPTAGYANGLYLVRLTTASGQQHLKVVKH